jgi:hypothetical protein
MSKVSGEGCCLYRSVGGGSLVKCQRLVGRGAARTDLLGEGALLNVKGEGGGVVACTGLWGGGLTLSCSYRSVGGED